MTERFGSPVPLDAEAVHQRKTRRLLSRSDGEIQREMDQSKLEYRAGWPALPPMPIDTIRGGAFEMVQDAYERIEEANTILQSQVIWNETQGFVFRVPRDAPETDDLSPYLTLLCPIDMHEHAHVVVNAITRIRSVFKQHDSTNDIQIEFIDYRVIDSLNSFPIHCDDSRIVERWEESVAPIVLGLLEQHEWLALEMIRRGWSDDPGECPPTIVITTRTAREPKWTTTIIPEISAALIEIAPDFKVEILCGVSLLGTRRKYEPSNLVRSISYGKIVYMGSSIGIFSVPNACSTLGGAVTLEGGVKCGITNWHCVRDDRLDQVVSETNDGALRVGNRTLTNAPQRILSPATNDHNSYLDFLRVSIETYKSDAARGKGNIKTALKATEKEREDVKQASLDLGVVYAGSGRRTVLANRYATEPETGRSKEKKRHQEREYRWLLDWALVSVDIRQHDVVNQLPPKREFPLSSPLVPKKHCSQWSAFNVNRKHVPVAKLGRTTGGTLGEINSPIVFINPKEDQQISAVHGFTQKNPGACYGVTKVNAKDPSFLEPRDSGSILLHEASGTQLGLLFGMGSTGTYFFIPIDLVFQDIERITGKKVVDPAYVKPATVGLADFQLED
ncbi:hypothetical protein ACJQWK_11978 [Exserohilum turcicum]